MITVDRVKDSVLVLLSCKAGQVQWPYYNLMNVMISMNMCGHNAMVEHAQ